MVPSGWRAQAEALPADTCTPPPSVRIDAGPESLGGVPPRSVVLLPPSPFIGLEPESISSTGPPTSTGSAGVQLTSQTSGAPNHRSVRVFIVWWRELSARCSGKPNPDGPGGWAALLISGNQRREISGGEPKTTNNRMELMAAISALEELKKPCVVTLWTDSQYLRNGITEWMPNWVKRGWKTAAKQPVKNQDLWQRLHSVAERHQVTWKWVKAHNGE